MLLLIVAFVSIGSVQAEILCDSSDVKPVVIELNKKEGNFYIPIDSDKIESLSTTRVTEEAASGYLSGTIDNKNFVILEGEIVLDGEKEKVTLTGEARQVFVGWDVPKDANPIYTKIGNLTMTRYKGATNRYATYVDVTDKKGKYNLHGEFYDDGNGGFIGSAIGQCLTFAVNSLYLSICP